jgi:uncharacterized protein YaaR (DUF327 family)
MKKQLRTIQNRIDTIKKLLMEVGMMRPGSLTKQMNRSSKSDKVYEYWQLSYTHKMRSRTEYVRAGKVEQTQAQVAEFKRFKQLVDEWIDLAIEQAKLTEKEDDD